MQIGPRAVAPCSRRPASRGPTRSVDCTNDIMIELVSDKLSVPFRNLRYLIVDDDADQRYLVGRTLNKMGMANVVEASSGRAALEVLGKGDEPIDVVISDLQMPDVDGMELIRRIGENAFPVSVILVSALDDVLLGSAATM